MHCTLCKVGETAHGMTTVVLHRGDTALIIKQVPADVCNNCGEHYLSEAIADRVLRLSEEAVEKEAPRWKSSASPPDQDILVARRNEQSFKSAQALVGPPTKVFSLPSFRRGSTRDRPVAAKAAPTKKSHQRPAFSNNKKRRGDDAAQGILPPLILFPPTPFFASLRLGVEAFG